MGVANWIVGSVTYGISLPSGEPIRVFHEIATAAGNQIIKDYWVLKTQPLCMGFSNILLRINNREIFPLVITRILAKIRGMAGIVIVLSSPSLQYESKD